MRSTDSLSCSEAASCRLLCAAHAQWQCQPASLGHTGGGAGGAGTAGTHTDIVALTAALITRRSEGKRV